MQETQQETYDPRVEALVQAALVAREEQMRSGQLLELKRGDLEPTKTTVAHLKDYFRIRLGPERLEHFEAMLLTRDKKLIKTVRLYSGEPGLVHVRPKAVVLEALIYDADSVVLAHNAPKSDSLRGAVDEIKDNAARLVRSLRMIGIRPLDYIVVNGVFVDNVLSMAEEGIAPFNESKMEGEKSRSRHR